MLLDSATLWSAVMASHGPAGCVLAPVAVGNDRHPRASVGGPPHVLTLFRRVGFIALCLRRPSLEGIFGTSGRVWVSVLCLNPPKTALCHTCTLSRVYDKYRLAREHLYYLTGLHFGRPCWLVTVRPGVPLLRWQSVMTDILEPQGTVPSGFNPLRSGWVYRLALEVPSLEECRQTPEVFWGLPGACGLRSYAWTHRKIALCHTCTLSGAYDKYQLTRWYDSLES